MPELPDIVVYQQALSSRVVGQPLERLRLASPFLLRSVTPPIREIDGRMVIGVRRVGKRLVLQFDPDLFLIIHLMIAGRLRWREKGKKIPGKLGLAAFDFPNGTLLFTEAGSKKRASMFLVKGEDALGEHDPGGLEPLEATFDSFRAALTRESHTLKRALTDPHLVSGIGNAYSDEILHAATLSPMKLTRSLSDRELRRLYDATRSTLQAWIDRLLGDSGDRFPEEVTAFRAEMAVHGRYGKPCPACGTPIQRIVYASNEANYCPPCQTGGKLLADRSLSRLLKEDWPRTLEELEERKRRC
ncbi:MAG: formamidopyrimidine-DNA glycosylase [Acidobacteria bacterium]|nr:formamidopyrimidine-DNA glycosylase [Acidobacteriota bacterium]